MRVTPPTTPRLRQPRKLWLPSGTVAETFPRASGGGVASTITSGTLYLFGVELEQGQPYTSLKWASLTTALNSGSSPATHMWSGIFSQATLPLCLAISGDDTSSLWAAGADSPVFTLGAPYVPTQDMAAYFGLMVAAATPPQLNTSTSVASSSLRAKAPVPMASSSTSQTTPPAVGAAMGALTNVAFLAYATAS